MWDQEVHHLNQFDKILADVRIRPSLLRPVWELGGYCLGAGSALLGKEVTSINVQIIDVRLPWHAPKQLRL